jgi:hypothetical protein
MAYLYVSTTQKPTAVTTSILSNFTSISDKNLLIARGQYLEIHTLESNGIVPEKTLLINGRITSLKTIRLAGQLQDFIFVLTAKKHFTVLGWDNVNKKPIAKATGNLKDRNGKE